jgi:nucleotide-binding universal stress UspA family protein
MDDMATVVVGIDGSTESRCALVFALQDASRRHARLRVVTAAPVPRRWGSAYGVGTSGTVAPPSTAETVGAVRAAAKVMVDGVAVDHPGLVSGVPIDIVAAVGAPAEVLLSIARHADLLVLGHRGHGGFSSALLGSVGLHCVLHAECPVTVVRPQEQVVADTRVRRHAGGPDARACYVEQGVGPAGRTRPPGTFGATGARCARGGSRTCEPLRPLPGPGPTSS